MLQILWAALTTATISNPLSVYYAAVDDKPHSKRCLFDFQKHYGSLSITPTAVPYARLIGAQKVADVYLCIPVGLAESHLVQLKKGFVQVRVGFILANSAKDKNNCGSIIGAPLPPEFKPRFNASNPRQLVEMFKLNRIDCMFSEEMGLVEEIKALKINRPYTFELTNTYLLRHYAKPESAKLLETAQAE